MPAENKDFQNQNRCPNLDEPTLKVRDLKIFFRTYGLDF